MTAEPSPAEDISTVEAQSKGKFPRVPDRWLSRIANWGVELRGVAPVPIEERTDTRFINVFFVWFTLSTNLLPYVCHFLLLASANKSQHHHRHGGHVRHGDESARCGFDYPLLQYALHYSAGVL